MNEIEFREGDVVSIVDDRPGATVWRITAIVTDDPQHDGPYATLTAVDGSSDSWAALRILRHQMGEFSLRLRVTFGVYEVKPGDQVDIAHAGDLPSWRTVERVGTHADDPDNAEAGCRGDCAVVLFFTGGAFPWHVRESDALFTRFPVGGAR